MAYQGRDLPSETSILVIGAGPAGLSTALTLALHGIPTIVIDKNPIDYSKCCAGGLTNQSILTFEDSTLPVDREINQITTFVEAKSYNFQHKSPIGFTINRNKLKRWFCTKIEQENSQIFFEHLVTNIIPSGNYIRVFVKTPYRQSVIRAKFVIGAFGFNHRLIQQLGGSPPKGLVKGTQLDIALSSQKIDSLFDNHVRFFFDNKITNSGYGWAFPKKDHVSLGVSLSLNHPNPRRQLQQLLLHPEIERLLKDGNIPTSSFQNHCTALIPIRPAKKILGHRFLLVGDAAGFVDPITLEGIYYALISGQLAAKTVCKSLQKQSPFREYTLSTYHQACFQKIIPELRFGSILRQILYSNKISQNWNTIISELWIALKLDGQYSTGKYKLANLTSMVHNLSIKEKIKIVRKLRFTNVLNAAWKSRI